MYVISKGMLQYINMLVKDLFFSFSNIRHSYHYLAIIMNNIKLISLILGSLRYPVKRLKKIWRILCIWCGILK